MGLFPIGMEFSSSMGCVHFPCVVSSITVSWGLELLCYPLCLQGSDAEEIMRPSKVQLAAYNCVHNKRMADRDRPMSTVNPQQYTSDSALWHWQSGTIYNPSFLLRR